MKCISCKFWTPPEEDDNDIGTCKAVVHETKYRSYDFDEEDVFDIPVAFVVDGSGYFAALKTKGDFCCCLYMDKELP